MENNNSSREEILNKIKTVREGRSYFHSIDIDEKRTVYKPILPDPVACFKNVIEAISGKCVICEDENDLSVKLNEFIQERNFSYVFCKDLSLVKMLGENKISFSDEPEDFERMEAGITSCEFLIARTGSVMVSSNSVSGRQMNIFPPVHIVIASSSQLVDYPEDALMVIKNKYKENLPSAITTITGPSRTADIEKTLVLGAHGPKEIVVFISKK